MLRFLSQPNYYRRKPSPLWLQQQHQQLHHHNMLFSPSIFKNKKCYQNPNSFSTTTLKTHRINKRKSKSSPPPKVTKAQKKIKHIKKSIQFKSNLQKSKVRKNIIQENILTPIQSSFESTKIIQRDEFVNKMKDFQTKIQNFILPESFILQNKDRFSMMTSDHQMEQRKLVMDKKWWMYNLFLSCVPGILVWVVCEYHRSEMVDYYEKMNKSMLLEQGEENLPAGYENGLGGGGNRKRSSNNLFMSDENSDNTQRKKKGIMDRMKEIANSMFGIGDNLSANTNTNSDDHSSQHHHAQDETSTGNHKNSMINDKKSKKDATVEELLARIETLEAKLGVKIEVEEDQTAIISNSSDVRVSKSNIQKRIEMRKRRQLIDVEEEKQCENSQNQTRNRNSVLLYDNFQELKRIIDQYLLSFSDNNSNNSNDGNENTNNHDDMMNHVHNNSEEDDHPSIITETSENVVGTKTQLDNTADSISLVNNYECSNKSSNSSSVLKWIRKRILFIEN